MSTLIVIAAATLAAVASTLAAHDPTMKGAGFDRIICRVDAPTGSLIPGKKVCRTKREWDHDAHSLVGLDTRGGCPQAESGTC